MGIGFQILKKFVAVQIFQKGTTNIKLKENLPTSKLGKIHLVLLYTKLLITKKNICMQQVAD